MYCVFTFKDLSHDPVQVDDRLNLVKSLARVLDIFDLYDVYCVVSNEIQYMYSCNLFLLFQNLWIAQNCDSLNFCNFVK